MITKITKKPVALIATAYRQTTYYSKVIHTSELLRAKLGTFSIKLLAQTLTKNHPQRKVSKKRTKLQAWTSDVYVVTNPNHPSNQGRTTWEGERDNGKIVMIDKTAVTA